LADPADSVHREAAEAVTPAVAVGWAPAVAAETGISAAGVRRAKTGPATTIVVSRAVAVPAKVAANANLKRAIVPRKPMRNSR
jgi:hypothetical protein